MSYSSDVKELIYRVNEIEYSGFNSSVQIEDGREHNVKCLIPVLGAKSGQWTRKEVILYFLSIVQTWRLKKVSFSSLLTLSKFTLFIKKE